MLHHFDKSSMCISSGSLHSENASSPMLVTLVGMVKEVSSLQCLNAPEPILVTLLGIIVFLHPAISVFDDVSIMALQSLRESYTLFPLVTFISVSRLQSEYLLLVDYQYYTL